MLSTLEDIRRDGGINNRPELGITESVCCCIWKVETLNFVLYDILAFALQSGGETLNSSMFTLLLPQAVEHDMQCIFNSKQPSV